MYTENEEIMEKRSFPLKDFLVKLLLIIFFIFILMWVFPITKLKPFYDSIFNTNISNMKEAGITYYTNERLPQKVGETKKLTLGQMLEQKIVLPFTDKNGKSCDLNKSYIEITKDEQEYVLKVSLTCGSNSDYLLVHLGCHDYCNNNSCQTTVKETIVNPIINKPTKTSSIEYEYKKTVCTESWSAYSAWTTEVRAISDSLRRISTTKTTAWSDYSTTKPKEASNRDIESKTFVISEATIKQVLVTPATTKQELVTPEKTEQVLVTPEKTEQVLVTPEKTKQVLVTPEKTKQVLVTEGYWQYDGVTSSTKGAVKYVKGTKTVDNWSDTKGGYFDHRISSDSNTKVLSCRVTTAADCGSKCNGWSIVYYCTYQKNNPTTVNVYGYRLWHEPVYKTVVVEKAVYKTVVVEKAVYKTVVVEKAVYKTVITEAVYKTVEIPAVYKTVEVPAVSEIRYRYRDTTILYSYSTLQNNCTNETIWSTKEALEGWTRTGNIRTSSI